MTVSRKPRGRFVNFSSKRPESVDVAIQLPTDSDVRGEADLGDFAPVNELYGSFFAEGEEPARVAIGVAALPKGAQVEIDAVVAL